MWKINNVLIDKLNFILIKYTLFRLILQYSGKITTFVTCN